MGTPNKELDKYTTIEEIQTLINGKVMESLTLEYKGSDALDKPEGKRKEISKDVSAFANSAGGTIIYGVGEKDHIPLCIEWIDNIGQERETLENVILSRIQPKIENFKIHAVKNPDDNSKGVLVVNILQSHTAHMASDNKYYKRRNFRVDPMEDYEVRDVMFRHKKPDIGIVLKLPDNEVTWEEHLSARMDIEVVINNYGSVVARHISGGFKFPDNIRDISEIHIPIDIASSVAYPVKAGEGNTKLFDCDNRVLHRGGGVYFSMTGLSPLISHPDTSRLIGKIKFRLQKECRSGIIKYWIIAEDMEGKEGKFKLSITDDKVHIEKL